jgi:hypothetical protein
VDGRDPIDVMARCQCNGLSLAEVTQSDFGSTAEHMPDLGMAAMANQMNQSFHAADANYPDFNTNDRMFGSSARSAGNHKSPAPQRYTERRSRRSILQTRNKSLGHNKINLC